MECDGSGSDIKNAPRITLRASHRVTTLVAGQTSLVRHLSAYHGAYRVRLLSRSADPLGKERRKSCGALLPAKATLSVPTFLDFCRFRHRVFCFLSRTFCARTPTIPHLFSNCKSFLPNKCVALYSAVQPTSHLSLASPSLLS